MTDEPCDVALSNRPFKEMSREEKKAIKLSIKARKQQHDREQEALRKSGVVKVSNDVEEEESETSEVDDSVLVCGSEEAQESFEESLLDVKVAVIGNVDSGKSTLVGVLTKGLLDDGRGKARSRVFNFSHEAANGRTSSVAQEIMGFKGGEQVILDRPATTSTAARTLNWQHIVSTSQKLVTFIDLCGHERYLKTTIFGLVGLCPDYAMIVVNANAGFQRMSREHLGIALALQMPIFLVVTKVDITPANVFRENMEFLHKLLRSNAVRREPLLVKTSEDVKTASRCAADKTCPIFTVSSVTGEGLENLKMHLNLMQSRVYESGLFKLPSAPAEVHIDGVFLVPGVGVVASGLLRAGRVRANTELLLGPDKSGQFRRVLVRSIHYKRVVAESVESGQSAALALRFLDKKQALKKSSFRKGMVLVDPSLKPKATFFFRAEVVILHHATTIRERYEALVHCGVIRQAARVVHLSCDLLRAGDKATVTFRFCHHGEFLNVGSTLLFREGRTKGLGRIIELLDESPL